MKQSVLSDELEAHVLSMVGALPDLIRWQLVCKRWRRLLTDPAWLPPTILDFDRLRPLVASQYSALLQRWRSAKSVKMTLQASIANEQQWQSDIGVYLTQLRYLQLRTTSAKALLSILTQCHDLQTLEVLQCHGVSLPRLPRPIGLKSLQMHSATHTTPTKLVNFLRKCPSLTSLSLSVASEVTSAIFATLTQACSALERLTLSQCGSMSAAHLASMLDSLGHQLKWLDLSHTVVGAPLSLKRTIQLPYLEGLVMDSTHLQDSFLEHLVCPELRIVSLQNCRYLSDAGILAFALAAPRPALRTIDLKNTNITESTVTAITRHCPTLTHLGIESCRGLPRAMRLHHALQASHRTSAYERVSIATNTVDEEAPPVTTRAPASRRRRGLLGAVVDEDDGDYELGTPDDEATEASLALTMALHHHARRKHTAH
ncbi:hypothetical protein ACHHYP_18028 [Achlya hypogyna]|uniref:F-box/LRR-repeat protein 15-like leucin rich repeat domain-containing protein n=1 Tax=Achlya hypogyna TaxID=1202772 RepID=A0A1V9YBJ0_ACHHY|nr:hypothetical protein ACHHYP_18028 [Achlya hypogyna]